MDNVTKNLILTPFNILYKVSPRLTLKSLFRLKLGYKLNLDNPKTYNEKLQWIKLYDRNPLMPICCDKYMVRGYVENKGCGKYLNELLWQGLDPIDIPFDDLPDKYVIKVTHGSTFNIINDGGKPVDRAYVVEQCRKWLNAKFLRCYGEWFYGNEKPRVVVEKYLENENAGQLYDYKVFCFNGHARYVRMDADRFTSHKMVVYDTEWNRLAGYDMGYPGEGLDFPRPNCLDELLDAAERLSADFHHARVDFYVVEEHPVFGEITFTNGAGFDRFHPEAFDREMGDWLVLPIGGTESD